MPKYKTEVKVSFLDEFDCPEEAHGSALQSYRKMLFRYFLGELNVHSVESLEVVKMKKIDEPEDDVQKIAAYITCGCGDPNCIDNFVSVERKENGDVSVNISKEGLSQLREAFGSMSFASMFEGSGTLQ